MRIAAFIGDIYQDYEAELVRTIERYAASHGHVVDIFGNCSIPDGNPLYAEGLKSIFRVPELDEYDGIFMASDTMHHFNMNKDLIHHLMSSSSCPMVNVRSVEKGFHSVVPGNESSLYEITKKLIEELGVTEFGFVTGRDDMEDSHERFAGFKRALDEHGLTITEDRIFHGDYWRRQGAITAEFFLSPTGTAESLPQAIVCSNDYMALALMDELMIRGIRIPEDVFITGVDNIDEAIYNDPPLSSIEISAEKLALCALQTLEKLIYGELVPEIQTVTGNIFLRRSCGVEDGSDDKKSRRYDSQRRMVSRRYIELSTKFEDCLTETECLDDAREFFESTGVFSECRFYVHDEKPPLSEHGTTLVLPINFRNESYGYCSMKLVPGNTRRPIDDLMEFVMLLIGHTLGRLKLYQEILSFKDIRALAFKDPMTGLYNRRGFDRKVTETFEYTTKNSLKTAVVSIDMNDLKGVNDNYGHSAGDDAIIRLSQAISGALREQEFAVRMGGDEFEVILLLTEPDRIDQYIKDFQDALAKANSETEYELTASIGACPIDNWELFVECMHNADKKMYEQKRAFKASASGKGSVR
ncbi:MAG: GGDEF domain-containing protein [Clostridiales bacterium]|nr:GGDEF domain-containing protein [Clostridiales bacterium]